MSKRNLGYQGLRSFVIRILVQFSGAFVTGPLQNSPLMSLYTGPSVSPTAARISKTPFRDTLQRRRKFTLNFRCAFELSPV